MRGFPLNTNIHFWLENHGWWNDDDNGCGSFGPGEDWIGTGWTNKRDLRLSYIAPNAGQAYPYEFVIEGQSTAGTTVSHPYHFMYEISYGVNAVQNTLVYRTLDGNTPKSLVCPGELYVIKLPYINGFSNGHFRWQKKIGGTWHDHYWGGNQITVEATSPPTEYRARLWSNGSYLGDNNDDPTKWKSTETNPITVLPNKPTGVNYIAGRCEGSLTGNLVIQNIQNATDGGIYKVSLSQGDYVPYSGFFTYTYQNPAPQFPNILPGSYDLRITAVNNNNAGGTVGDCTALFRIDIPEYPLPTIHTQVTNAPCFGENGNIRLITTNYNSGPQPYTFQLLDTEGTVLEEQTLYWGNFVNFTQPAGAYQVRVLNAVGCESPIEQVNINEPTSLPTATYEITSTVTTPDGLNTYDTGCATEGEISVTPSGGLGSGVIDKYYTIEVYDSDSGNGTPYSSIQNAREGIPSLLKTSINNNHIIITDETGCSNINPLTVLINAPPVQDLTINPIALTPPTSSCVNDGEIDLRGNAIGGGLAPYYVYLNNQLIFDNVTQVTALIDTLPAGIHQVKVVDQLNCIKKLEVDLSITGLTMSTEVTHLTCFESADGVIQITAAGGNVSCTSDCDYKISVNDGSFESFAPGSSSFTLDNLAAGNYQLRIQDGDGCEVVENLTLIEPDPLIIENVVVIQLPTCRDDLALLELFFSGGNPSWQITFQVDGGTPQTRNANNVSFSVTPGSHSIQIFDDLGCPSNLYDINIVNPTVLDVTIDAIHDLSCPGADDGRVELSFGGGYDLPFKITLLDNCETDMEIVENFTDHSISFANLAPGLYCVQVEDRMGCQQTTSFDILSPAPMVITTPSSTPPSNCSGQNGSITVSVSQGTPPYEYSLDGLGFSPGNVLQGAGIQNRVYIRDSRGCVDSLDVSLAPYNSPLTLSIPQVLQHDYSSCGQSPGEISFVVSNYAAPITLHAVDCNSSSYPFVDPIPGAMTGTIDTTITIQGLSVGTYCYVIYDGTGCFQELPEIVIEAPDPMTLSVISKTAESCYGQSNDGTAMLQVTGGTPPYTFISANGNTTGSSQVTLTNLNSGQHIFSVIDQNGCSASVEDFIETNAILVASTNVTNAQGCPGLDFRMDATLNIQGGTPPYTVQWPDGSTGTTRTELPAGNYRTTISDQLGCSSIFGVLVPSIPPISLTIDQTTDVSCTDESSGSVSLTAASILGGIQYSLDNIDYYNDSDFHNLPPGNYTAYAKDNHGCINSQPFEILLLNDLSASYDSTLISCHQAADGTITVNSTGGDGLVSFALNGGPFQTDNVFTGLSPGTYNVVVQDNSCELSFPGITLTEPSELSANTSLVQDASCGQADGIAEVIVSGGVTPYAYEWNGNPTLNTAQLHAAGGVHTVVVTDANGCEKTGSVTINDIPAPSIVTIEAVNAACGEDNGSVEVIVTAGTPPFTYEWNDDPSLNTALLTGLPAGTYNVVVTDARACTASSSTIVGEEQVLSEIEFTVTDEACGQMDGQVQVAFSGGTPPFTFEWDNDPTLNTQTLNNAAAGIHQLVITDSRGMYYNRCGNNCRNTAISKRQYQRHSGGLRSTRWFFGSIYFWRNATLFLLMGQ